MAKKNGPELRTQSLVRGEFASSSSDTKTHKSDAEPKPAVQSARERVAAVRAKADAEQLNMFGGLGEEDAASLMVSNKPGEDKTISQPATKQVKQLLNLEPFGTEWMLNWEEVHPDQVKKWKAEGVYETMAYEVNQKALDVMARLQSQGLQWGEAAETAREMYVNISTR